MLELSGNNLVFHFPDVHPSARVTIGFQRTLRIPDDDKTYPLPPSLGAFPVRHVEDFQKRLPEKWQKRGGVMLPMYQSEAMWLSFTGHTDPERGVCYPFALKIAAGKQSAVTGKPWSKHLKEKDYCIVPLQPWLDGYVVDDGHIRQFVAMPLGGGFTVEEQLTGKAEFGGLQIEAIPMKRAEYEQRFPKKPPRHNVLRSMSVMSLGSSHHPKLGSHGLRATASWSTNHALSASMASAESTLALEALDINSMGLGAGGRMKQQVFADPYGLSQWATDSKTRCFIHLADSMTWRAITNEDPPTVPLTAADYTSHGYPWFDYYSDSPALKGTKAMQKIKTVKQVGKTKGIPALPENTSTTPKHVVVIPSSSGKQVRDGVWK